MTHTHATLAALMCPDLVIAGSLPNRHQIRKAQVLTMYGSHVDTTLLLVSL